MLRQNILNAKTKYIAWQFDKTMLLLVLCIEDYVKLEVAIGYHDSLHCVFD